MKRGKSYTRVSILLALVLLLSEVVFLSEFALAQAPTNVALNAPVTASFFGEYHWRQDATTINDGGNTTYYGGYCTGDGCLVRVTGEINFSAPQDLTRIVVNSMFRRSTTKDIIITYTDGTSSVIDYRSGVGNLVTPTLPTTPSSWSTAHTIYTLNGSWNNVEKIGFDIQARAKTSGFNTRASAYIIELEAWGLPSYIDSGLRVVDKTGAVVAIAAWPLGEEANSPLRIIAGDGKTYGIALVDVTAPPDPNDSGIRIQTTSGLKALRKYE